MPKYRPSNGTEGMQFEDEFCDKCEHDNGTNCEILFNTMIFDIDDEEYPEEWQIVEGKPTCTKFEEIKTDG
jgi:hypothetical protein